MFNSYDLYQVLKPKENPSFFTSYPLILGGTSTTANLIEGAWILNVITTETRSGNEIRTYKKGDRYYQNQARLVSTTYQLDFYKAFDAEKDFENVAQIEAMRMREWLAGVEVMLSLKKKGAEIAPPIWGISFNSEIAEGNITLNRSTFEFKIFSKQYIDVEVVKLENAEAKGVLL